MLVSQDDRRPAKATRIEQNKIDIVCKMRFILILNPYATAAAQGFLPCDARGRRHLPGGVVMILAVSCSGARGNPRPSSLGQAAAPSWRRRLGTSGVGRRGSWRRLPRLSWQRSLGGVLMCDGCCCGHGHSGRYVHHRRRLLSDGLPQASCVLLSTCRSPRH